MGFPYGKAPLAILLLAALAGGWVLWDELTRRGGGKPDLVFVTFVKNHALAYAPAIAEFEQEHGVKVQVQVVDSRALQSRLQSSLQVGAEVPGMVELLDGTMGIFTKGTLEQVGFVDLTDRIMDSGLYDAVVTSRFGKWSNRGRIFALPHDVHPVMLAYRRDLIEQLGIDVSGLTIWDKFCEVGLAIVTKDLTGDGVPDRYMIDLPDQGGDAIRLLLLQHGGRIFDEHGNVAFDSEEAVDVITWYVRQVQGPQRIAFSAGWGQTFVKSINDGLCLFFICPDWRTKQLEIDLPKLKGKMGLMPLPAWEAGGLRTTTWGGTGLAITKQCDKPDLAWQLAMHLYFEPRSLGQRFADSQILPPLKTAWNQPEFDEPNAYFSNIPLGRAYADLAPSVPEEQSSAYMTLAVGKLSEAYTNVALHHREHGEQGLREYARKELHRTAGRVREVMSRNVFLHQAAAQATEGGTP